MHSKSKIGSRVSIRMTEEKSVDSVDILYEADNLSSSTDPPMEEWSSLILQGSALNLKLQQIELGLLDPGSGEVCAKYLVPSDSTVLYHPYYKYPPVLDPGIVESLFSTERAPDYDSQRLYKNLCKEMDVLFIRKFYDGLVQDAIDLKFYCVPSVCIRSMCLALEDNERVRRLDLSSSYLDDDAWYHFGWLLQNNRNLKEIILSQCRMGPLGLRYLIHLLPKIFQMDELDVSKNGLGSAGAKLLTDKIVKGSIINRLNLSHNELSIEAALGLADAFRYNLYGITYLDLSWNEFHQLRGLRALIGALTQSKVLQDLNLSWNGIKQGPLQDLFNIKTLERLDLSNNVLPVITVRRMIESLTLATHLKYLNLSYNPIEPKEAYEILLKMRLRKVHIETLLMDNVPVTMEFEEKLKEILEKTFRQNTVITHGRVMKTNALELADMRDIVMKRLHYLSRQGPKKNRINILEYILTTHATSSLLMPADMLREMKKVKSRINEELIEQLSRVFPGPRIDKHHRAIDLDKVADYISRVWPNARAKPPEPSSPQSSPKLKAKSKTKAKGKENQYRGNKMKK